MTKAISPAEIEAKVEGTPLGVVGRLTATATTQLAEAGTGTVIRYAIDATLTGKLGSMGQPVLKAKAKEMEKQFSARLAAAFAGGGPGARRHDAIRTRRAGLAQGSDRADRSGRSGRAADRRRHRADADDEGRRVPAAPAGEPAQAGRWIHPHRRGAVRRTDHRRAGAARRARAFARGRAPCAGDRAHHEAAVQCARAQCGDRGRRAGAWRPAHGPAAGADRARRHHYASRVPLASAVWRSRTCSPAITKPRSPGTN